MNGFKQDGKAPILLTFIGVAVLIGSLRIAREILIPVAVAVLLSFLLAPLVRRLTTWGFPNVVAVLTTVAMAVTVLGVVGWLVSAQFVNLVNELPNYQGNLQAKISDISKPRDTVFSRAWEMVGSLRRDIERQEEEEPAEAMEGEEGPEPIPVQIEEPAARPVELLAQYAGPLLGPLGLAGISSIFVIFILLQRNDLRDRFVKLVGGGNLNLATQAVDDAARRITRYLLMQMIINVTYGIPLGVGLYFIGVPNALLWGILATLLRFLPFVGPWIAAFFPISLAIAVDPGWTMPLLVIALVIALELTSNNVIEPWLYGASTGISIVALMFAALLWTWIWGPIGLFLSTPLTVCLLVMGKNVPSLNFLHVLLGSEPVLPPEAQMYQRMLSMDPEGMIDQAEKALKSSSLTGFYDQILIPALAMAEIDRHAGTLAEQRQQFIIQGTRDLIEELGERHGDHLPEASAHGQIICTPARDEADELTTLMLVQLLSHLGIAADTCLLSQTLAEVRNLDPGETTVCLCAIPPGAITSTRRKCRELHQALPSAKIVAGIWGTRDSATEIQDRLASCRPDFVATSLADMLVQIAKSVSHPISQPMVEAPLPANEAARLDAVHRLGILDTPPEELYDAVTRKLAGLFEVPISLVTIIDADRQFWKSHIGLPPDLARARGGSRSLSLCGHVVAQNDLLAVEDLTRDERFANNPFVKEGGIRFYAGVPLRTDSGHAVGSLCVIDMKPRKITAEQRWLLQVLADQLMQRAQASQTEEGESGHEAA